MSVVDAWNQKSAFWAKKLAQETKFLRTLHFQTEMYSEARSGAVRTARAALVGYKMTKPEFALSHAQRFYRLLEFWKRVTNG